MPEHICSAGKLHVQHVPAKVSSAARPGGRLCMVRKRQQNDKQSCTSSPVSLLHGDVAVLHGVGFVHYQQHQPNQNSPSQSKTKVSDHLADAACCLVVASKEILSSALESLDLPDDANGATKVCDHLDDASCCLVVTSNEHRSSVLESLDLQMLPMIYGSYAMLA